MARRATILLVDDDDADLMLAARLLRRAAPDRYRLLQAANLDQALATLRVSPVDAVLLDLNLGSSGGPATVAQLRNNNEDTLIVVLTGHTDQALETACLEAGADFFLGKASLSEGATLIHTLEFALGNRKPHKTHLSQELRRLLSPSQADHPEPTTGASRAQLEQTARRMQQDGRPPLEVFSELIDAACSSRDASTSLGALAVFLAQAYYEASHDA